MNRKDVALDLEIVQQKLANATGKTFWRSLEELAGTPAFEEMLQREFPENSTEWGGDAPSRRRFLTLMGASLALAGLAGCSKTPNEKILPYIIQPEGIVPGKPQFYASALSLGGQVTGVLVESHMGRPTKIEGNPEHPGSRGATDVFAQAEILSMYDPDRESTVTYLGQARTWDDAVRLIGATADKYKGSVRILTEAVTSPTLAAQLEALLTTERFKGAKVTVYEPTQETAEAEALAESFKDDVTPVYHLAWNDDDKLRGAQVIVALDADFLTGPGVHLKYARDFGERRRVGPSESPDRFNRRLNRLYMIETMISPTGSLADHRLALKPSEIEDFVRALAAKLGVVGVEGAENDVAKKHEKFLNALVSDLTKLYDPNKKEFAGARANGTTVIIPGPFQPKVVHQLAHAINDKLGNLGKTVQFYERSTRLPLKKEQTQTLTELIDEMKADKVKVLLILGGNPYYNVPAPSGFLEAVNKVTLRVHASVFADETSAECQWHLPLSHTLEQWSDAVAFDGTATIVQPLIAPLFSGRSTHELVAALGTESPLSPLDIVKVHWQKWYNTNKASLKNERSKEDFELFWKRSLADGVVEGTAKQPKAVTFTKPASKASPKSSAFEVVFRPDAALFDGRYANNGWMQEFPKPLTKITWDNVAHMSPATAQKLGITQYHGQRSGEHGETYIDRLLITVDGQDIRIPAWIVPGHADGCVTLTIGYGRTRAGRVSMTDQQRPVGVDVNPLRASAGTWAARCEEPRRDGKKHLVACIQAHHNMEGRDLVRTATLGRHAHDDHFHHHFEIHGSGLHGHGHVPGGHDDHEGEKKPTEEKKPERVTLDTILPPEQQKQGYQRWGMVINLSACTGCSACVIACQAEKNIPVVGKDQVNRGREMHWLRIDRYYAAKPGHSEPSDFETYHQPIPCQQCENAPCEQVCPVSATVHSDDGLNDMIYNRCVGTRYCSNNCPYKVRRFNFFGYNDWSNNSLKMLRNPEVTVRTRGVMEKCTYCVQRIRSAEVEARREGREIRTGEVVTACQAVCPTGAIVFGDLGPKHLPQGQQPGTDVGKLRNSALSYTILDDLNTFPRTSYMAAVRNLNPLLAEKHEEKKG